VTAAETGLTAGGCFLFFFLPPLLSFFFLLKFIRGLREGYVGITAVEGAQAPALAPPLAGD
jgi:hypothetical protein